MRQVLFLCSANYYRSRFAEHLFNHLAAQQGLHWRADSRGLMVGNWGYLGSIANATIDFLTNLGVPVDAEHRQPIALDEDDLQQADLVVAVKELEHRREIQRQFPQWEQRVEFWDVHDLDCATPEESLPYLADRVEHLVERLKSQGLCH